MRIPIIAIVGRPNVGKSTFFNRVLRQRRAVVEDIPGVTRDRVYALIEHYEFPFYLVDTGGFEKTPGDEIQEQVSEQALIAAQEADIVLALFDGQHGLHPGDEDVVDVLRRYDKPVRYVVNKCDGAEHAALKAEFFTLGLADVSDLSALHGRGVRAFVQETLHCLPEYEKYRREYAQRVEIEEEVRSFAAQVPDPDEEMHSVEAEGNVLLAPEVLEFDEEEREEEFPSFAPVFSPDGGEDLNKYLKEHGLLSLEESVDKLLHQSEDGGEEPAFSELLARHEAEASISPEPCPEVIKIALVGRPNVGKSTLLNTLCGERRAVTSAVAGTTRDVIDLEIVRAEQKYRLMDTAGLRRQGKVEAGVERYSVLRTLRAVDECDVAVVMLDAVEGPTDQDAKVIGLAHEAGKGIVLVVNKWDAVEKDHRSVQEFKKRVEEVFKFSTYAPVLFVSALSGRRCPNILDTVREVAISRQHKVPTTRLNKLLAEAMRRRTPPVYRGRPVKLFFAAQVAVAPPRFVMFFNFPEEVHFSYLRFLKNSIREEYSFVGTDLKLVCRKK